jgi:methionine sulfoxide reductase catalytic subunit
MLIKPSAELPSSEITPRDTYLNRRKFLTGVGLTALAGTAISVKELISPSSKARAADKIAGLQKSPFSTSEKLTPMNDVTHYNNYYEFSTEKDEPAKLAQNFRTRPWSVTVDGAVPKKLKWDIDEIMKFAPPEERIYRHRCVEGWSIVVPWIGFSLSEVIKRAQPLGKAKFVQFTSIEDPNQMPGQRERILDWPYTEGLRMDEAMHPLTLLCFGMYGGNLANQDGAPLRLIVPWKYGFKSAKAIVKISFVEHQPNTTWNEANPHDFGFYSNVNPNVERYHSQASEHRLGEFRPRPTLMFNGYDQVAGMYTGMDLVKNY